MVYGTVKLTKNVDPDKYKYSSLGIGFDYFSEFSLTYGSVDKNINIFEANMRLSVHIDNKNKSILVLGEGATQ